MPSMTDSVRAFMYGTLRTGDYNHHSMNLAEPARPAVASGKIYHHGLYFATYPVSKFDEEGTIIGEVMDVPMERWLSIVCMEQGAGYELMSVEVTYGDGSKEKVAAWHYIHEPRGNVIDTGDWFDSKQFIEQWPDDDEDEWDDDDEDQTSDH